MTSLSTAIPYTAGKRDDENGDVGSNISETENIGLHQDSVALTFNQDTSLEAILSAQDLLSRNPIKFGFLDKYSNSFLAWLLPFFFPRWRRRFFILVGNYLFRFSSESGDKPKGVPIPLDVVTVVRSEDDESCFELTTIRKTYLIRAESEVRFVLTICCDSTF